MKTEKRPNTDLLQSVLHNAEIGMCAIDYIFPEVESENFQATINVQKSRLKSIVTKAHNLAEKHKIDLKPNSCLKKGKMCIGVKMSSFWDDDTQHLAEMMILGHFMGTINMIKSLADCKKASENILAVARELKDIEEKCVNELVAYLERTKK